MKSGKVLLLSSLVLALASPVYAQPVEEDEDKKDEMSEFEKRRALSERIKKLRKLRQKLPHPVPSGLFGIYAFPEKGQGVAGINYQHHEFEGLIQGSNSVSPETVVTTVSNRFFGNPMQPPTLRVVPRKAKADVIFPYANFTINDKFSLVGLVPLIRKETVLETYAGSAGTNSLGTTTVTSEGLGDIKVGTIYKAYNSEGFRHNFLIDAVVSIPTGSITEEDYNLTPMNTKVKTRLGRSFHRFSKVTSLNSSGNWAMRYISLLIHLILPRHGVRNPVTRKPYAVMWRYLNWMEK